ncbi:MAG: hypothetical protein KBS98_06400 [Flavobacterium sp.]|nr:hypothetical protein [Candidatus Neoflavobacterium equi]
MIEKEIKESKNIGIYAYITIVGTLVAMMMNAEKQNPYASFHIRQALGLNILFWGLSYIIGNFNSMMITSCFWVFFIVLWVYAFTGALNGQTRTIPFIGTYFQKWFKML